MVVPIEDRSLDTLNQGRAGAKLQFRKITEDTIEVELILYIADSTYYATKGNTIAFYDFTGQYIVFDLGLHFKQGVVVHNGYPIGWVDDFVPNANQTTSADVRTDLGCIINMFVVTNCYCETIYAFNPPVGSSLNCNTTYIIHCNSYSYGSTYCDPGDSPGAPPTGGGGGGGGGWGGTPPSSNGNGGTGNPGLDIPVTKPELDCSLPQLYWACMFFDVIATNLFSDNPNAPEVPLPYGFDEALFGKWLDIVAEYKLDMLAAQWLITHRDLIDEIHAQLPTGNEPAPTSPDPDDPNPEVPVDMKALIEFCAEVGLNQEQWRYLLENPGFLEAMKEVFQSNFRDEKAKYAVKSTINLQMNGWFDKADWTEAELEDVLENELKPILHEHYIQIVQEYIYLRYADPRFKEPCNFWCATKAWAQATYTSRREILCMRNLKNMGRHKRFEVPNLNFHASPESSHQQSGCRRRKIRISESS